MARRTSIPVPRGPVVDETGNATAQWVIAFARILAVVGEVELLTQPVNLVGPPPNVPALLTLQDTGTLIAIALFNHVVRWAGDHFYFAPGDEGNAFYRTFPIGPPQADGWQLCDGSATTYLVVGGPVLLTAPFVTPVVANQYFRR